MKLEVLVTTMYQENFDIISKMNIQTDAVVANQTNNDSYDERIEDGRICKFVSTNSRGLSRNRNIALAHANQKSELLLFADDDLVLNDNYEKMITEEFKKHPNAEAIKFNLHDQSSVRKISMKRITKFSKATRRNMSSSGVCGLVVKQKTVVRNNLHFNEYFGTGTENYCGEDTIFIQEMINKGVNFYRSPIDIAGINQSQSTWFNGYDKKYFIIKGKLFATVYPLFSRILAVRSSYKFARNNKCNLRYFEILRCYFKGINEIKRKK